MSKRLKEYLAFFTKSSRIFLFGKDVLLLAWLVVGLLLLGDNWTGGSQIIISGCFIALFLLDMGITEKDFAALLDTHTKHPEYFKSSYVGVDILCHALLTDTIIKIARFAFLILVTYVMVLLRSSTITTNTIVYITGISLVAYLADMFIGYVNACVAVGNFRMGLTLFLCIFCSGLIGGFTAISMPDEDIVSETLSIVPAFIHIIIFIVITAITLLLLHKAIKKYRKYTFTDKTIGKEKT